jgi:hypothetical protein
MIFSENRCTLFVIMLYRPARAWAAAQGRIMWPKMSVWHKQQFAAPGAPNDERRRLKSGERTAPVLSTSPPARILNAAATAA